MTAYGIDCDGCTGTTKIGTTPKVGKTIAVDPDVIPLGSQVMINGNIFVAEDVGSAIQGNSIDLFLATEEDATEFGVQYYEVYILEE